MPKIVPTDDIINIIKRFPAAEDEKQLFLECCAPAETPNASEPAIGTLNEKPLHAAVKRFICPDVSRHEIPPIPFLKDGKTSGGRYIADILTKDGVAHEVQTTSLYPLRSKVGWYFSNTHCFVNIVCAVPHTKWISYIDTSSGEAGAKRKSPKRGGLYDILPGLYWLRDYLCHSRFSLTILFVDIVEYRVKTEKKSYYGKAYERAGVVPVGLSGKVFLCGRGDYAVFVPQGLPECFTAKDFSRATLLRGKNAYSALNTLVFLGVITPTGEKSGRSALFTRNKNI